MVEVGVIGLGIFLRLLVPAVFVAIVVLAVQALTRPRRRELEQRVARLESILLADSGGDPDAGSAEDS